MNLFAMFRTLFLDAGGTLLIPRESPARVYADVSRGYGCSASPQDIERRFQEIWHKRNGLGHLVGPLAHKDERKFWRSFVQEVFDPFGPLERFDDFVSELHKIFADTAMWQVYPDALETLDQLRARGVKMAVVSNWDSQLPGLLKRLGLKEYFSAVLASTMVGWAKPAREIFEEALRQTGSPPNEVVHVGDSAVDDVGGARQAGIHGVLLDRLGTFREDGVDVIRSLLEVVAFFDRVKPELE